MPQANKVRTLAVHNMKADGYAANNPYVWAAGIISGKSEKPERISHMSNFKTYKMFYS